MEEEEDTYARFGTPLEPLDEDEVPSKKPIAIEDQIVTDENGKRRFHGAFTGGFSAGFWNTVGSLEGWKPQSFKSSRAEKAEKMKQRPIDFMDDEDLGEFGIAPQRVQTTDDFTKQDAATSATEQSRKRKLQQITDGPIPGTPVLHQLLQPAKETVAIRLLKKMGWKEGQGVGARQTRKEKKLAAQRNARERYVMKMYGCDMGPMQEDEVAEGADDDDDSDISDDEITFAPDDFEPFVCSIKTNTFGLGYQGLSRDPVLQKQHINLFGNAFEVMGKDNKKLSIRGQAFGVGALEEEDEDIYARDDMTRYDFSLDEKRKAKAKSKELQKVAMGVLEGFAAAQSATIYQKKVFTVAVPENFKPRNWAVRRSRFEPIDDDRAALIRKQDEHKILGLGRHDLDPDQRGQILGESAGPGSEAGTSREVDKDQDKGKKKTYLERINEKYKTKDAEKFLEKITSNLDKFAKVEVLEGHKVTPLEEETKKDNEKVQAEAKSITKGLDQTPEVFKPFIGNAAKQDRYEKFLEQNLKNDDEITNFLATIQPLSMTDWDREMEKKEFNQARNIYRPLKGLMSDRFITESTVVAERATPEIQHDPEKKIKITRTKAVWKPSSQLCKRFNIAEPFGGAMEEKKDRRKPRFSVFDYLETSVNTKENFVTPVIIPTKAEKPKPIISQSEIVSTEQPSTSDRLTTKELFASEMKTSKIEWQRVTESKSASVPEPAQPIRKISDKNKTPLEKKVEEMKSKHPSEKKDLFKAIFDSDSEEEPNESETKEAQSKPLDAVQLIGTEAHKDIFALTKQSAAEINVLRNTSPPRGIFANLFAKPAQPNIAPSKPETEETADSTPSKPTESKQPAENSVKISFRSKHERWREPSPELADLYGPKVPSPAASVSSSAPIPPPNPTPQSVEVKKTADDEVDVKLLKLLKKSKKPKKIVEEWIEKADESSDRKKKKRDKEKDKKKKSKKHKKEKKRHKDKK